ncbi:CrcB-like protein [Oceanicola granulosus HTCC2516]|uniref:Fluoride-specific ion channel FluC n=1 Tax=Oceanicola granulosus (strain ATCC BAA-861 / DSM 15982 / KCTC 12143 / HTCC2516) TaxID=314256 RepID=Q2CBL5_OCEGH|nr:fluoride efflux transporter CrcB [Oceanicola granulosus]EAR50030.1 CrcB-like protein [Oceanicola granulosus HTCC2516]
MFATTLAVAAGGALGAAARHLAGLAVARASTGSFPLGVLSVNVVGSFLMGLLVVALAGRGVAPFWLTGVLGGFTTFSAFSLEAVALFERGAAGQAALYVALSVGLSLAGLVAGLQLARGLA